MVSTPKLRYFVAVGGYSPFSKEVKQQGVPYQLTSSINFAHQFKNVFFLFTYIILYLSTNMLQKRIKISPFFGRIRRNGVGS